MTACFAVLHPEHRHGRTPTLIVAERGMGIDTPTRHHFGTRLEAMHFARLYQSYQPTVLELRWLLKHAGPAALTADELAAIGRLGPVSSRLASCCTVHRIAHSCRDQRIGKVPRRPTH